MHTAFYLFYNLISVPLFYLGFYIFSSFNKKARLGLFGRLSTWKQLRAIKSIKRDTVFIHSSSSGEWEQAVPFVKMLKAENPDIFILASFFSYSGMKNVKSEEIDLKIYLPFDSFINARRLFSIISPKVWILSKYDVWPNMLRVAHKKGIPTILASAELAEDSVRYRGINKLINRQFYKKLTYILPKSEDDKKRFQVIIPSFNNYIVTGDARFDQIFQKAEKALQEPTVKIFSYTPQCILIGGSMWPADEKHVLPAMAQCLKKHESLSIIIAPHELHEGHISAIESFFANKNISTERYTDFAKDGGTTSARVAILNTIGMLAKVYKQSDLAYVGGSFSSGVHNTMEPAVYGQPVVFGPKYKNAYEACELVRLKGGFTIKNEAEAFSVLDNLISDEESRKESSKKAKQFLTDSLGASEKTFDLIKQWL